MRCCPAVLDRVLPRLLDWLQDWLPNRPSSCLLLALFALPGSAASAESRERDLALNDVRASAGATSARQRRFGPYLELQAGVLGVRHANLDVFGPVGGAIAGTWVRPGIGIELFADTPLAYGDDNGFEAGVSEAFGAALRLRSPPVDGLYGYVVLGYADFTVHQEPFDGGIAQDERFTGMKFSVGLMQRLKILPAMLVSAEYRNFYVDEPVRVDGLSLGLRLDIR